MPTFDTPGPISVTFELAVGEARITASDRTDTVVDVRPTDASNDTDVKAAEQTRVDFANGTLRVKAPKSRSIFGKPGAVDLTIQLPAGSTLRGDTAVAAIVTTGPLGECRLKTGAGDVQLEHPGALNVTTGVGHVDVDRVDGDARVSTGSGTVRVGAVDGAAVIKNSNGDSWVGEVAGDVRLSAANGDITVDKAAAAVEAKTANGNIRIGDVSRGSVQLNTSMGELEIGVREGTAAWLDVSSSFGNLRNSLDNAGAPADTTETVEVRGHTAYGDIVIRRA